MARLPGSYILLLLLSCAVYISALPIEEIQDKSLVHRAPGDSEGEAIPSEFNAEGWPISAEFNCYIMLCVLKTTKYKRVADEGQRRTNYRDSGAQNQPFNFGSHTPSHGAQRPFDDMISAEEFPWESLERGGTGAHIFPTTRGEQASQGGAISSGFDRVGQKSDPGQWIDIRLTNFNSLLPFCPALYGGALKGKNPDSYCRRNRRIVISPDSKHHFVMEQYDQVATKQANGRWLISLFTKITKRNAAIIAKKALSWLPAPRQL